MNGGTIISYVSYSKDNAWITFVEDDLFGAMGGPCSILYPAESYLNNIVPGERIILVYSQNGAYIPMRVTDRTRGMIPMNPPEYFNTTDWVKAEKLSHPSVLNLDKTGYLLNEKEVDTFFKKCNSLKSIQTKNWIGIICAVF